MSNILSNWKTSLGGVLLILLASAAQFAGIHVPGFNIDLGAALITGIPLILASDAKPSA